MISLIKILTIITFSALATTNSIPASRVLELNDKFLDIYQEGQWLVMMYAPWSADCKKMESVWGCVAQYLHATSIRVGRIDGTRFTSVAQTFKINGFPTIMFIKGDQQFVYNGDRTRDDIVQFAHRLSGPAVQEVTKTGSLNNFTDHDTLADRNNLNETLYERVNAERFPTIRRGTAGVVEENQTKELHSTNTNCKNCTNCTNCINCTNCTNCSNCTDCTDCSNCTNLSNSKNCTDCVINYTTYMNSKNCTTCKSCVNCSNCYNCTNCVSCNNCSNCTTCVNCNNCHGCGTCTTCSNCRNCFTCTNCSNRTNGDHLVC